MAFSPLFSGFQMQFYLRLHLYHPPAVPSRDEDGGPPDALPSHLTTCRDHRTSGGILPRRREVLPDRRPTPRRSKAQVLLESHFEFDIRSIVLLTADRRVEQVLEQDQGRPVGHSVLNLRSKSFRPDPVT